MHSIKLKQLEDRLYSQIPLIGGCLRQRAAKALARDGSPDTIRVLAKAIARSDDRKVLAIALDALRQVRKQSCIDEVCAVWAVTRHKDLANLLVKKGWVASAPVDVKVLSALKAGQLEVITKGGIEIVEPLLQAFSDVDPEIASRASQCASAIANPDVVDYLCERWSKTRDRLLEQVILQGKYVARQPVEVRVLTALKVERLEVVTKGGKEVVEPLIKAFSDTEREIAHRANQCIAALKSPDAIDYLCEKWASTRDRRLEQIILQGGYIARQPIGVRVLSALKTGNLQTIARDETQIISLLLQACRDSDPKIATEATAMLGKLQNQQTIDALCNEWAKTRTKHLTEALQRGQYVAASPAQVQVLSALKVGRLEAVTDGGTEVVELLLQACKDGDPDIAKGGHSALRKLKNPKAQESLCCLVIEQDHQLAREIAVESQYAPRDSKQRALFYFLTKQWDKYESLDYEHTILQTLYELGDEQLRKRIAQKARKAGRVEWTQIVAGGRQGKRLGEMTAAEWETTLAVLSEGKHWEEIWQLAQAAPPIWSVQLLGQLKDAEWVPKTELAGLVQIGQKCVADALDKMNSLWCCRATLEWYKTHFDLLALYSIAISPDSKLLASGDGDTVKLWSLPEGKLLQTLSGHNYRVDCLAVSPDGKLLASGDGNTVKLWSLPDGKLLQTLTWHSDCLIISPDGKLLASWDSDGIVNLWSLPDGKPLQTLSVRSGNNWLYLAIAISPDSKLLASWGDDNAVKLWSLPDGNLLQTLTGHSERVRCLAISPDVKLLASGSDDNTVKLWSLPDGKLLQTLTGHGSYVICLAISPDIKLLASGSGDNTVKLWNLPNGKLVQTLTGHGSSVTCLAISPDNKLLASGSSDGTVKLWSLADGKPLQTLIGGWGSCVICLGISPDGKLLVSADDYSLSLWTSNLHHLSRLPVEQMSRENMQWVQEALQNKTISEAERDWLKFIQALVSWRRRFDVEVEDAPQRINTGEFDIEIER